MDKSKIRLNKTTIRPYSGALVTACVLTQRRLRWGLESVGGETTVKNELMSQGVVPVPKENSLCHARAPSSSPARLESGQWGEAGLGRSRVGLMLTQPLPPVWFQFPFLCLLDSRVYSWLNVRNPDPQMLSDPRAQVGALPVQLAST